MIVVLTGKATDGYGRPVLRSDLIARCGRVGWSVADKVIYNASLLVASDDAIHANTTKVREARSRMVEVCSYLSFDTRLAAQERIREQRTGRPVDMGRLERDRERVQNTPPHARIMPDLVFKKFADTRLWELPEFDDLEFDFLAAWQERGKFEIEWARHHLGLGFGGGFVYRVKLLPEHVPIPRSEIVQGTEHDKATLIQMLDLYRIAYNEMVERERLASLPFQRRTVNRRLL